MFFLWVCLVSFCSAFGASLSRGSVCVVAFIGGCVVVSSVDTKWCRVNRDEPNNESRNESTSEEDFANGGGEDIGLVLAVEQWSVGGRSLSGSGTMEMKIFMKMKVMRDDTDEREERLKNEERSMQTS
ncbi:hypothetical protein QYF36_003037 [Acer negundo]|nr:hypothetical protein QYF36_003037 [Acer negundo]